MQVTHKMMNDAVEGFRFAANEIQQLQQRNMILEAQMGVVRVFEKLLNLTPQPSQGCTPDPAWRLRKAADEMAQAIEDADKPQAAKGP